MVAGTKNRPAPTFDRLAKKKPIEIHEWIPLSDDAVAEHATARREMQSAELIGDKEDSARFEAAKAALAEAEEKLKDNSVEVIFRSIGRPAYDALMKAHPPTEAQSEEHKREHGFPAEYNAETFAPALISAACIQPEMTPEQVESLITEHGWNSGEYVRLFTLAMQVNQTRRVADLAF